MFFGFIFRCSATACQKWKMRLESVSPPCPSWHLMLQNAVYRHLNFLAWVTGFSHETDVVDLVKVPAKANLKILLPLVSRNRVPKQLALALTVQHHFDKLLLISRLNGLGHCVAASTSCQHEQDLAILHTTEHDIMVPDGKQQGISLTSSFLHIFYWKLLENWGSCVVIVGNSCNCLVIHKDIHVEVNFGRRRVGNIPPISVVEHFQKCCL